MGQECANAGGEEAEREDQRQVGQTSYSALLCRVERRVNDRLDGAGQDLDQSEADRTALRRWNQSPTWLSDRTVRLSTSEGQKTWATLSLMSRRA